MGGGVSGGSSLEQRQVSSRGWKCPVIPVSRETTVDLFSSILSCPVQYPPGPFLWWRAKTLASVVAKGIFFCVLVGVVIFLLVDF